MPLQKYINRIRYIDSLVRIKGTGNADQLAKRMDLSRSVTLSYISAMKQEGFPIKYCRKRNSYYYSEEGRMTISLFEKNGRR